MRQLSDALDKQVRQFEWHIPHFFPVAFMKVYEGQVRPQVPSIVVLEASLFNR